MLLHVVATVTDLVHGGPGWRICFAEWKGEDGIFGADLDVEVTGVCTLFWPWSAIPMQVCVSCRHLFFMHMWSARYCDKELTLRTQLEEYALDLRVGLLAAGLLAVGVDAALPWLDPHSARMATT